MNQLKLVQNPDNIVLSGMLDKFPTLFQVAAQVALPVGDKVDQRGYWLGAVGVRRDGVIVSARNGSAIGEMGATQYNPSPTSHAERRCLRKLGWGGVMYVARVRRDGSVALAKPCARCQGSLKSQGVKKVFYTIDNENYGVMVF
jgi:tRNA(Arg) A34 adenosine deaminase TadA